jgi:hypothetical protein
MFMDSVTGAWAGIGCGFASTAVVFATTGIEEVALETCGGVAGAEDNGAAGDASEGL